MDRSFAPGSQAVSFPSIFAPSQTKEDHEESSQELEEFTIYTNSDLKSHIFIVLHYVPSALESCESLSWKDLGGLGRLVVGLSMWTREAARVLIRDAWGQDGQ